MHYWRKDSFEKLDSLKQRLGEIPELIDYFCYVDLLSRGLRKEALKHIEGLISTLRALPKDRQHFFVSLLCRENEIQASHRLLPEPLHRRFIQPVVEDWKNTEPTNPEPLRWTGNLDDLVRAVALDPSCDQTRRRLILRILGLVGFSTHELPAGYLGNVENDYDLLHIANRETQLLHDADLRKKYLQMIQDEQNEIDEYLKNRESQ
jgi:hypothetical protein